MNFFLNKIFLFFYLKDFIFNKYIRKMCKFYNDLQLIDRQIDYVDRQMDKVNDRQIDIQNKILYGKKVNF